MLEVLGFPASAGKDLNDQASLWRTFNISYENLYGGMCMRVGWCLGWCLVWCCRLGSAMAYAILRVHATKNPEISGHEPKPQLLHMHADARFVEVLFGELLAWGSAPAATEAETKNLRSSYSKRYAKLFGPLELGWGLLVINLRRTFNQRVSCQGFSWLGI